MNRTAIILLTLILFFSFIGIVKADMLPPSMEIIFYFQKAGQPFNQPVKFTVKCYGTNAMDNKGELFKISELSGNCKTYGCKYDFGIFGYGYKEDIKYCDIEGETDGSKFLINKFIGESLDGLNCRDGYRGAFSIIQGQNYYKTTPEYENCIEAFRKKYFPGYLKDNCIDYELGDKRNACYAKRTQEEKLCDKYLMDVTSKVNEIDKDEKGDFFDEICEIKVNVPFSVSETPPQKAEPTPTIKPAPVKNFFVRTIDFIRCSFLKLFGKTC